MALHGVHGGSLKGIIKYLKLHHLELLTIPCFFETVVRIMVRRVNVHRMTKFLQSESGINHKAFGTAWRDVWRFFNSGRFRDRNAPIPRSGCRNAMRSCGLDMKRDETWFPRSLVIATQGQEISSANT